MIEFRYCVMFALALWGWFAGPATTGIAQAQPNVKAEGETADATIDDPVTAPEQVVVVPDAEDDQIAERLERILKATEYFRSPEVRVDQGVVFLSGRTSSEDHRQWARQMATNTQDVVAVVNRIEVDDPSLLDFSPAWKQLRTMARSVIQGTPTFLVAVLLFMLSVLGARLASRMTDRFSKRRIGNALLSGILAKAVAIPVLILGAYLALRVSGLTRLAATVLGGTGLIGVVFGIAFRDIAENFLASILISMQRPFEQGDLVTINGLTGYVRSVTTRGTQLMTLDGNHVQVPNSTVYKSVIENASANPNLRQGFILGIDYEDSAAHAQATILQAVSSHEAVLADPEPLVLVDELAASTVNLRIWFWLNGRDYSALKVRSAVLRRVKKALRDGGFTLPDEAREVIFPQGVPVRMVDADSALRKPAQEASVDPDAARSMPPREPTAEATRDNQVREESAASETQAEGGLQSDQQTIEEQAAHSRRMGDETDLLSAKPQ
ncbi:MAG: mechanosensitive ion channel [Planctomycetales bacterium]|nr:mechanosensitive ion channel [Planctomycetales bacterium]